VLGSLFAGTEEAPGEIELFQGRSYKIYRGTTAGGEKQLHTVIGSKTIYQDTAVNAKVPQYFYQVTAVNAQGQGPRSNEVIAQ